jgi:hypothetical protein
MPALFLAIAELSAISHQLSAISYSNSISSFLTLTFIPGLSFARLRSSITPSTITSPCVTRIPATPPVPDEADLPDASLLNENPVTRINCEEENITSVIWATGFSCDWSWIKLPVLNDKGQPNHVNGSSQVDGLYFMGLPWQRNLKSSLIFGATEDAAVITTQILNRIPSHSLK